MAQSLAMKTLESTLIDIGANLTSRAFAKDLHDVIARAVSQGVDKMLVTGTSLEHSEAALQLCEAYAGRLYSTCGIHPHHAGEWTRTTADQLKDLADHACVRAIGECGLDYNRNFSTPHDQRYAFEAQLELAAELQLPVFLHQRDAHDDFVKLLEHWRPQLVGGVAHCFTGNADQARAYLDLDLDIGITGWICDERRGQDLQQAVKHIPVDRLMIETDAPYLMPRDLPHELAVQLQPRRNEPMTLPHVCRAVAGCMNTDAERVASHSTQRASQLFSLDD